MAKPRIGLLLAMYEGWSMAFPRLNEQLEGYLSTFSKISADWADVVNPGIITKEEDAVKASRLFTSEEVVAIVLPGLFSPSGMVMHALPRSHVPILILNTQLSDTLPKVFAGRDSAWTALKSNLTCLSVPDVASTLGQTGRPYVVITGSMSDESTVNDIRRYLQATYAVSQLRLSRIGVVGPRFIGMLDVSFDEATLIKYLGVEILDLAISDLERAVDEVSDNESEDLLGKIRAATDVDEAVSEHELRHSVRVACGITDLARKFDLDALALGEQEPPDFLRSQKIGIFPGLQDLRESGRSLKIATETDVRGAICLLLFQYLGRGAIMCEAYMMDISANMILLGHDGPPDLGIAKPNQRARVTFCNSWLEGIRGRGCVVEYGPASEDATVIMLVPSKDGLAFVVAEGRIADLPTLPLGMPNFWFIPDVGVSTFYQRWTQFGGTHHFVIAHGRLSTTIEQISALLHLKAYKA